MKYEAIENWLQALKDYWVKRDLKGIASLFTQDVEYWETPYKKLDGVDAVSREWRAITDQNKIVIDTDLMAMDADRSTVKWELDYEKSGIKHKWSGLYLIQLNAEGLCSYFYQVGEAES